MSSLLYRLGKFSFRKRGWFVAGWIIVLAIVGGLLALNPPQTSSEFSIPGTPSQSAMDQLSEEIPATSGTSASVTLVAPQGERVDTPERIAAIETAAQQIFTSDYVVSGDDSTPAKTPSPDMQQAMTPAGDAVFEPLTDGDKALPGMILSPDGHIAQVTLQLTESPMSMPSGATDQLIDSLDSLQATGLTVLPSAELTQTFESPMGPREAVGLVIAAIVLLLTLGTLRIAGMPLLTAIIGVGTGVGAAYALSSVISMTSITPILALMIGLAVGIDYALFIVNRARRLVLDKGLSAQEATGRATGTAGSAVFFAGLTVLVSLAGLSIVGIAFLTTMALIAAGTVAIAVLVALTLLPALLGFAGERIVTPAQRAKSAATHTAHGGAPSGTAVRWVTWVTRHKGWTTVGAVAILVALAVPFTQLSLNLPSAATANTGTAERQAYDAVTDGFGEGFNGTLLVVAHSDSPFTADSLSQVKDGIVDIDHVSSVIPGILSDDSQTATFTVVPDAGPNATTTVDLVHKLRSTPLANQVGADLGVTGVTAINIDMSSVLSDALAPYLIVIVVISLLILMLVFRSIYVPVTATIGFVFTIGASLGATTAVFQWGWLHHLFGFDTPGPILSFLPIIVTGILYGLAMDYQVFLVSSMRESHVHGHPGVAGVIDGFRGASRVVVAAGIIMISVFASFIFGDDAMIKQIGFALAFGILIDAFLVRMTLIPAVMALVGERAWSLPRWLDRLLPNLDVEGDKLVRSLEREHAAEAASHEPESVPVGS